MTRYITSLISTLITVLLCLVLATPSVAANEPDLSKLSAALGGQEPDSIAETPVEGLYEVVIGSNILYLSKSGRYAIQGDVIDLTSSNNLTETRRNGLRAEEINAISEDKMIIFPAKGESKHTVSVFTDIDCGYCQKLHREMDSYNESGITIRYLAFPRAGIGSESYKKAVSAWCAEDQQTAMTRSKQGKSIEELSCDNPVADQYRLGQRMGVRGTPSIILSNGEMVPGYVPATRLVQTLENL